jgi:hypothetical protein
VPSLHLLFASALWALPLVGLPVVLHLLFRRKSPVVMFPTIRFLQASIQQTAARKRVHRWTLLACRALALLLLILAVAQPASILASGWSGNSRRSLDAAVVIDTSYSMLLNDQHITLLARADGITQELLRGPLKNAKVAIFSSRPAAGALRETLAPAATLLTQWSPLHPEPNPSPLADRLASAIELLKSGSSDDKWLVVISDFQKKEFPRQLAAIPDTHVVFLDLHPATADSAGVGRLTLDPPQPIAGISTDVVVDLISSSSRARPIAISVESPDGQKLLGTPPQMAAFDTTRRVRVRFPINLPSRPWLLIKAAFSDDDDMSWDNSRQLLVRIPPRQIVSVISNPAEPDAMRFVSLALDPSRGKSESWPLLARSVDQIAPDANVAVLTLDAWPDAAHADKLHRFASNGGTLIWFLRPGLEQSWQQLAGDLRNKLAELLPSEPIATEASDQTSYTLGESAGADPLLTGLADKRFALEAISVLRLVPFATTSSSANLLTAFPIDPRPGTHSHGFLYRRPVGTGMVYTIATLPEPQYTNLPTHPLFLPLLVRMALPAAGGLEADNIEIGPPIVLSGKAIAGLTELRITDPLGAESAVELLKQKDGTSAFVFAATEAPGVYRWHKPGSDDVLAFASAQLPAAESDLTYARAEDVMPPGDNIVTARSVDELQSHVAVTGQPEPRWQPLIAAVLILLCVEAFLASMTKL